mmetsp:Transcript_58385/g.79591  ORF Transcript_58385/g.79591 Transcript_58385/m.79591 type:complete len:87 (+) Transcript_58385:192-452(+)
MRSRASQVILSAALLFSGGGQGVERRSVEKRSMFSAPTPFKITWIRSGAALEKEKSGVPFIRLTPSFGVDYFSRLEAVAEKQCWVA